MTLNTYILAQGKHGVLGHVVCRKLCCQCHNIRSHRLQRTHLNVKVIAKNITVTLPLDNIYV